MPGFDDRLTRELERAARPAAPDVVRTFEDVTRRRAHRTVVRKIQVVTVVVAILVATAGAFVVLDGRFDQGQPMSSQTPPPSPAASTSSAMLQWRPVVAIGQGEQPTCAVDACTLDLLPPSSTVVLSGSDALVGRIDVAYTLGPVIADGTNVLEANLTPSPVNPDRPYEVTFQLDEEGTRAFSEASAAAAGSTPPHNQIAIVWNGEVISAPYVAATVTSGSMQVSFATREEAQALLDALNAQGATEPIGRDVGLGFRMCRVQELGDLDLLKDGSAATAYIGGRVRGERCSDPIDASILAVDLRSDGTADTWVTLPRCVQCRPFGAMDLDADGAEELFVLLQWSSTPEYGAYRIRSSGDVRPVLVVEGNAEMGLLPDVPFTFWAGGDEGTSYSVACEREAQRLSLVLTQTDIPVDAPTDANGVRLASSVIFDARGAFVTDTVDQQFPVSDPLPPPKGGGCPLPFQPFE